MKRMISLATAGALALAAALTVNVAAQDFNLHERTFLTFSNPVELPGTRLEPGTYVFRLADTPQRNIVQVLSEDESEMLGQWLFIQAQREEPTGETVITFRETRAGATPAVQYWYYPGETIGKEFIYPEDQAMQIAQRTGATVMTEDGPVSAGAQTAAADIEVAPAETEPAAADVRAEVDVAEVEVAAGADVSDDQVAVGTSGINDQGAVGTSGIQAEATVGLDEPAQRQAPAQSQTYAQGQFAQRELPRTASPLPMSGLIALLSLAGAAGVRAFRR